MPDRHPHVGGRFDRDLEYLCLGERLAEKNARPNWRPSSRPRRLLIEEAPTSGSIILSFFCAPTPHFCLPFFNVQERITCSAADLLEKAVCRSKNISSPIADSPASMIRFIWLGPITAGPARAGRGRD